MKVLDETGLAVLKQYLVANLPIINLNSWERNNLPTNVMNYGMAYINGYYFVCNNNGNLLVSTDGENWTSHQLGSSQLNDVIYFNDLYIVSDNGKMYYSSDLINWNNKSSRTAYALAKSDNLLVGVGWSIVSTSNGTSWSTQVEDITDSNGTAICLKDICYGNGLFVAVGQKSTIMTSTDGITWTTRDSGLTESKNLNSIYYANGLFIVGGNSVTLYSTDGINWTTSNLTVVIKDITFFNDTFYLLSSTGKVCTTKNGIDFETFESGFADEYYAERISHNDNTIIFCSNAYLYMANIGKNCTLQEVVDYFISKIN